MLTCLKMSDPVGLTMAGKIDVLLLLGKGEEYQLGSICTGACFTCQLQEHKW